MDRRAIAVIGQGTPDEGPAAEAAREVGRLLAEEGATVVTGGLGGVMAAAGGGARAAGGRVTAVLPGTDRREAREADAVVATGVGEARDLAVVASADAVIAVGGGLGHAGRDRPGPQTRPPGGAPALVGDRRAGCPGRGLRLPHRRQPRGGRPPGARGRAIAAPRPILIHGSGGDHRVLGAADGAIGGAVAVDLPGHPDGNALDRVESLGRSLRRPSAAAGAVLVGHSLGGVVALKIARIRPDLVDGLVLIASGARLPVPEPIMERARADPAAERRRLMEAFLADGDRPIAGEARAALEACADETLAADYAACAAADLRGRLADLRTPALVVAGGEDRLTPPWLSEELARELPMAQMVLIPGARHMVMADPDGTVNLLPRRSSPASS